MARLALGGAAVDGGAEIFESEVRPVFADNCVRCHGPEKQKAGLRLDSPANILAGSDNGPVIEPGDLGASVLIAAIRRDDPDLAMPPKEVLGPKSVEALERWVAAGAPIPEPSVAEAERQPGSKITDEDRAWWAFQPLATPPAIPEGTHPVDHFVGRQLAEAGLALAPEASPAQFIRRATFDLVGLPPTPAQLEEFANRPLGSIDALLADKAYGERQARFWLDLVRYSESDGYRADAYRPQAYRYRDYVIDSFNADKPYDRFVQEQVAGDEMFPGERDALVATGLMRHGVYEYNNRDAEGQRTLILDELTDTVGDVFLGLGMACARCHDHKFDPILQDDYYRLQAFFAPLIWRDDFVVSEPETPDDPTAYRLLVEFEEPFRKRAEEKAVGMFPPEVQEMYRKPAPGRTPYESQIHYLVYRQVEWEYERLDTLMDKADKERWKELREEAGATPSTPDALFAATDLGDAAPPNAIPADRTGRDIPPGFLAVLGQESPPVLPEIEGSTGRRTALALWLTSQNNPLTARVVANRIWQQHFGTGLAANSSDFGRLGEAPTHPELLDFLARYLIEQDWHLKPLHRLIMTSRTYRQAASGTADLRLVHHFPARRLDAEQVRDAMLATSGELQERDAGPPDNPDRPVRTVYTKLMRNSPDPLIENFDGATGFSSTASRQTTTTPIQSLLMINGAWTLKRAAAMAKTLEPMPDEEVIRTAYLRAFGRSPSEAEVSDALTFLDYQEGTAAAEETRELPPEAFVDDPQFSRWGTAFQISDPMQVDHLRAAAGPEPEGSFTVEGIVRLTSVFDDASVRTIAARWDGNPESPGWALGVTSKKSRYIPQNLILQISGHQPYAVVPSGHILELNKPYYIGLSLDFEAMEATFFTRDMSYDESELLRSTIPLPVTSGFVPAGIPFTIGSRSDPRGRWDGLIDEIRVTARPLTSENDLLIYHDAPFPETTAYHRFDRTAQGGVLEDGTLEMATAGSGDTLSPRLAVLTDFCHALLNSNEFLYVE
ncbi:hypothetical protein BH23VER1_BH23VER1_26220 [soil metagenome]